MPLWRTRYCCCSGGPRGSSADRKHASHVCRSGEQGIVVVLVLVVDQLTGKTPLMQRWTRAFFMPPYCYLRFLKALRASPYCTSLRKEKRLICVECVYTIDK